uniref:NADH-ubiquinone oxidoreductase chain 2 n=1 Tax=Metaphycus eriococci TaxID=2498640 RepID=A0A7T3PGT0_9HYME|nr:NADH dehydrogenase subunit 2 [Metaphycus eriococci]QPZ53236.1 NADH dehydrogenase subunit 2 [Metaphycus eriococci]
MKFKFLNLSFFIMLITNILMLFINSWFYMWMIMEINLICFIKMLKSNKNFNNELIMNYFIIQSFNSYMFFMSFMLMESEFLKQMFLIIMIFTMMSKLGLPPFMMWYFKMMINLKCWMMFFINSCIQKFIPLMVINYLMINKNNMMNLIMLTFIMILIFLPFLGMNSYNISLMMSISSIVQMLWLILLISINEIWIIYFLLYSLISFTIFMMFKMYNIYHILDMYMLKFKNISSFYILNINILSLGGLPPFLGFMMKFLYIWNLMKTFMMTMILLILMSLINLFFYMRPMYSFLSMSFSSKNYLFKVINMNNKKMNLYINLSMITMMAMLILEMI